MRLPGSIHPVPETQEERQEVAASSPPSCSFERAQNQKFQHIRFKARAETHPAPRSCPEKIALVLRQTGFHVKPSNVSNAAPFENSYPEVERSRILKDSTLRGITTNLFWTEPQANSDIRFRSNAAHFLKLRRIHNQTQGGSSDKRTRRLFKLL